MKDIIMTARGEPFKLLRHAQKAVEDKPGYIIVDDGFGGFIGVFDQKEMEDFSTVALQAKDIICPGCGLSYHKTTDAYDPDIDANPAMIQLKEPWLGYGWDDLGKEPSMGYGCLVCPNCDTALAPSGKLRVE